MRAQLQSWRVCCIALMAIAVLGIIGSATAKAQEACMCDGGTIYGSDDLECRLEVCMESEESFDCVTVSPGSVTPFQCRNWVRVFIKDCWGVLHEVTSAGVFGVPIATACCVIAFLGRDEHGCLILKIARYPCLVICP